MAKTKLKTVERETTVSRDALGGAFAVVRVARGKSSARTPKSAGGQKTGKKKSG
jgi:hypothetical protein